jgi:hypothetical protein
MSGMSDTATSSSASPSDQRQPFVAPTACPPCPSCGQGFLIPMSEMAFWVCTSPGCTYCISARACHYYKGHALAEQKTRGEKSWNDFDF